LGGGAYGSLPDAEIWWYLRTGSGGVLTRITPLIYYSNLGTNETARAGGSDRIGRAVLRRFTPAYFFYVSPATFLRQKQYFLLFQSSFLHSVFRLNFKFCICRFLKVFGWFIIVHQSSLKAYMLWVWGGTKYLRLYTYPGTHVAKLSPILPSPVLPAYIHRNCCREVH